MDQEQIQQELEAARRKGALQKRLRLTRGPVREARALIVPALKEDQAWRIDESTDRTTALFVGLKDRARKKLIKTLLPHVHDAAESAWEALVRRPYQGGVYRKPFRCPNSAQQLAAIRGSWLLRLAVSIGDYDKDVEWFATWGGHLGYDVNATDIGWLLAGALDRGGNEGDRVFEILSAIVAGEHPTGRMGRHVTQALMACSREDAWELNEKLLLAAQRQEGLRQTILETVDESHPQAFRRMLKLILDENLVRFSSVVRAADTWFGLLWDAASGGTIAETLRTASALLEDSAQCFKSLADPDPETAFLALWAIAFDDVQAAIDPAISMLSNGSPEKRFVAVHFLRVIGWSSAYPPMMSALGDTDLRVATRALDAFEVDAGEWVDSRELFDVLEQLLQRLPKKSQTLDPIVWPWWKLKLERKDIAKAMCMNGKKIKPERLLPYVRDLDSWGRESYLGDFLGLTPRWGGAPKPKPPKTLVGALREVTLELLGDPSPGVRAIAFRGAARYPLEPDEVARMVELLRRKAGDLRAGCIARLRKLEVGPLMDVCEQLTTDKDAQRRLAGLELLRDAVENDRGVARARKVAQTYLESYKAKDAEQAHLDVVLGTSSEKVTRDDCLGLIDRSNLPSWPALRRVAANPDSTAAARCIDDLARLVLEHQDYDVSEADSTSDSLLIDAGWTLVEPVTPELAVKREPSLPLADMWRSWVVERPKTLRDSDGYELVRAMAAAEGGPAWSGKHTKSLRKDRYGITNLIERLLAWCVSWDPPEDPITFCTDILEACLASLTPKEMRARKDDDDGFTWDGPTKSWERKNAVASRWYRLIEQLRGLLPTRYTQAHAKRLYAVTREYHHRSGWMGWVPGLWLLGDAQRAGILGPHADEEFIDCVIGPRVALDYNSNLREIASRKLPDSIADLPDFVDAVARMRQRIVEVECQRGDQITAASKLAVVLRATGGIDTLKQALPALGKDGFSRTTWYDDEPTRKQTLSHLIVFSSPAEGDTPETFAEWVRETKISEKRLVEFATYAPHWAEHVSAVLKWKGFESAVWWIQAHTKDDRWQFGDNKEVWAAQVSERTPLSTDDLTDGAVDVGWFHEAYKQLGKKRWEQVHAAARYASSSGGHKRAQLFAEAMTGTVRADELLARIDDKRHQDSVRALGLLPLPRGKKGKDELLARYARLQEFKRESRQFGSQRKQSEGRAVTIGLENLARTAGYKDPLRLQWAMEMESIVDLIEGPVTVTKGDVAVTLSIDDEGKPSLSVARGDKKLKAVPAKLKKDKDVVELKDRLKDLRRQAARVKGSLEESMCRGDVFEGRELQEILVHPVLSPALSRLVFVGDDIIGYPVKGGKALEDAAGKLEPVRKSERLRLAHPQDLLDRGDWSAWQRDCYLRERIQPFKQVFRELYPLTKGERKTKGTRRYAGHQVNPRQALALLGSRGWVSVPEEGVSKTFHHEGLTVRLDFEESFYTPAEIEGLTLDEVAFTAKGRYEAKSLDDVPPRVFSETMRDLDLVVSVAHQGGVDPEASASTVEMRASLVRETCQLLGLDNVTVKKQNLLIEGELATYTLHLGSAVAAVAGGRSLVIVAVHSQHRGRLFLPFADDDPRTAEVVSKLLLLARDREIKDPTILAQIT